jgi:hypothetical protein
MNFSGQKLSIEEARRADLVDYLAKLGHEPAKIKGNDYWYSSPLRNEKTPSFKVNRKLNRWYDHGLGKGGNIIDFAILYNNCTIGEFLNQLSCHLSFQKPFLILEYNQPDLNTENKINILREKPISSLLLLRYLQKRRISIDIAEYYCVEVIYNAMAKNILLSALKIIPVVMNYVTLISKEAALQKTLQPLTIGPKKRPYLKVSLTSFLSWQYIKINLKLELIL